MYNVQTGLIYYYLSTAKRQFIFRNFQLWHTYSTLIHSADMLLDQDALTIIYTISFDKEKWKGKEKWYIYRWQETS